MQTDQGVFSLSEYHQLYDNLNAMATESGGTLTVVPTLKALLHTGYTQMHLQHPTDA